MAQEFSNGYALLIGVGGDLAITVKDVEDFHKVLVDSGRAGYPSGQVRLVIDSGQYLPNRQGILAGFNWLIGEVKNKPQATVIVYYSGHGREIKIDGKLKGYTLVPLGYDPQDRAKTGFSGAEFAAKIAELQVQKLLVLLDCCHAGAIPGTKDEELAPYPLPRDLDTLNLGSGQVIMTSSYADELSGFDAKNSYFTTALLEALDGKGGATPQGQVPILRLLEYIFDRVPKLTGEKQHPFLYSARGLTNFPVCYALGGGFKGEAEVFASLDATELAVVKPMPLSSTKRMILTAERDAAQGELEIRLEKLKAYADQKAIEAGTAVKFQLEKEFLREKLEIKRLEDEITAIDERLNA